MTEIRSQPTPEGLTAPTDDEICDRVLGTRSYCIRSLGYGITTPSSSCSSRADIHFACKDRLTEVQRQTVENRQQATVDRQQAEQRAQELAVRVDQYQ